MKLSDMNTVFLTNKAIANEAASLAALTQQTMDNINDILVRLSKIRSNPVTQASLYNLIGDDGVNHINSMAAIFYEAKVKLDALEASS